MAVLVILSTGFAILRLEFEGPALADKISTTLNKRMRGRIEIGSVEWPTSGLKDALTGGWVPVTMRDVRVWDDCALNTGAPAVDEVRWGDPNEDCTRDERPDPDPTSRRRPRKLLLRAPLITAEIDVHALMFGNHDFVFRNVWVHGGEALLEQTREPYPLHAYDRTIVSLVTAFYPRMKAGYRAGIFAQQPPPIFDLRDIHVKGINLTVHIAPGSSSGDRATFTTARFEGVDVDAGPTPSNDSYLYVNGTDPLIPRFYVRLQATARHGTLRWEDEGPREAFRLPAEGTEEYPPQGRKATYEIELADVALHRLAQLPTEWARKDYVAKTLELDLEARTLPCRAGTEPIDPAKGARLHVTGELFRYWDRPYDGSWNLVVDGKHLGPTIRTCIKSTVGGESLEGTITLTGPFVAPPKIGLSLHDLDFDVPLRANEEPLRLTLAEVEGSIDLVNDQGSLDKTTALIRGGKEPGEVVVAATFGLEPYNARAHVEITKAIDVTRFLPAGARPIGGFLQGRLTASGDDEVGFALEEFDLALGRTPRERSLRVHRGRLFTRDQFDTIRIQQVMVEAGRSRARVNGEVDLAHDDLDITIEGFFPDLDVWLARFGLPAFVKSAGGGVIRIKGPITRPTINVAAELGGVPCLDKVRIVDSQFNSDTRILEVRDLRSSGFGGSLRGTARLHLPERGRTVIEKLHVEGRRLDASRICKIGKRVRGTIDRIDVDLAGTIDPARAATDWLKLAKVHAQAKQLAIDRDRFTDIALCLNRKDDRACRPRSGYLDRDDLQQCELGKRDGFCAVATATRVGGGTIDATIAHLGGTRSGRKRTPARLGGTVALSDVPVGILERLLGTPAAAAKPTAPSVGGLASATLHLQGSPDAPQAYGAIHLLRAWVAGSFIGDTQLAVEPATIDGKPGLAIEGRALAGRLELSGTIGTRAPFPVELAIRGTRVELDALMDLQQRFGLPQPVQAWVSGKVTVRTELAPTRPIEPEAWVELTELVATVTHRSPDGRLTPVRIAAVDQGKRPAVSLRVTPSSIELKCREPAGPVDCTTRLALGTLYGAPAGVIDFRGHVAPRHMAIEAVGKLDLAPIAPLVGSMFSAVRGTADVTASISGTFDKPSYEASLLLDQIAVRPTGGDTWLVAPAGLIKLANGSLGFTNVRVRVLDRLPDAAPAAPGPAKPAKPGGPAVAARSRLDESGELHVKGLITLDGLKPAAWNLLVDGKLAGKMLLVLMPDLISQASGLARIEGNLLLTGKGPRPSIAGTLVFDDPVCGSPGAPLEHCRKRGEQPRSITVIPRGLRRELAISRGSVEITTRTTSDDRSTYELSINGVAITIDGEGTIHDVNGYAELNDGELAELELDLKADAIPFGTPDKKLNLVVSTARRGISISKPNEHANLSLRGEITIVDGTFRQDFEITEGIRALGTSTPASIPVWDVYPMIGNAELDVGIEVSKFGLESNIAQIDLSGRRVALTGTPREPHLDGQITVDRGRFRLPGMRAAFTNTTGTINFNQNQRAGNPALEVRSEANYRDLNGQDHVITLRIAGTIDTLTWDLTTSTGYNKSQTVALLLLGRNPEQLRRSLGDQTLGSDPTVVDPSTNPSQGFADQIVRDLAGDWVSDLLEDSLTKFTKLDVLRIQVGFGAIGLHFEKRLLESINLLGTGEQTVRGYTINVRGEWVTPIQVTTGQPLVLQGSALSKNFNDPAEQDITDYGAKLVFRLFIP